MTQLRIAGATLALILVLGCHTHTDHAESAQPDERPVESYTHYGLRSELFVEFPALVSGMASPFAAHLTTLPDFKPLEAARFTVVLPDAHGREERFETSAPTVPGIFRPVATPAGTGERNLTIEVATSAGGARHDLGTVAVASDVSAVRRPAEAAEPHITFLKEQQWRTEFATVAVGTRTLRPAVPANGAITARTDGEAYVVAPLPGRLVVRESPFPRLGMEVRRDQVLAAIAAPRGAA